jgi:hypothetical protein
MASRNPPQADEAPYEYRPLHAEPHTTINEFAFEVIYIVWVSTCWSLPCAAPLRELVLVTFFLFILRNAYFSFLRCCGGKNAVVVGFLFWLCGWATILIKGQNDWATVSTATCNEMVYYSSLSILIIFLYTPVALLVAALLLFCCSVACETEHQDRRRKKLKRMLSHLVTNASLPTTSTECSICMEEYKPEERVMVLPCKHEFHPDCIRKWCLETPNANCPLCRQDPLQPLVRPSAAEQQV